MMPNKDLTELKTRLNTLKANIQYNFPLELQSEPIWLAWELKLKKDGTFTKPPLSQRGHSVKDSVPGCTLNEALRDGYPGVKINKHTTLIAFDVDDKDAKIGNHTFSMVNLSNEFKTFVADNDTYMEYSPSKCGLRLFFHCLDKEGLPGRVNLLKEKCLGGELFINSGYVTVTGDKIAGDKIKEISANQLTQWFEKKAEIIDIPIEFKEHHPTINIVKEALDCCMLDQCDRVKNAYKTIMSQDYSHYDYWLKIMAACHHYAIITGQMNEMTQIIMNWSKTDEMSFESEEDVIETWMSFSDSDNNITYSTLMKFAKLLKFQWPEEKYDKNGDPTGKPIPTSLNNFKYLMEYYDIKIYCDIFNRHLYVTGNDNVISKFFNMKKYFGMTGPVTEDHMEAIICFLAQENGYNNVAANSIAQLFRYYILGRINNFNMLKMWLETPYEDLPEDMIEKNTEPKDLDYLLSCIEFNHHQNIELAKQYFETLFFEMVMPIYNPERIYSQRSFMLVLTGPEACRKTTFFTKLFPANLRKQFVTNSTETLGGAKSIRDFSTSLVTSALVICDEFEIFYNKNNDSLFKTLVTSDNIDYVPIYGKTMQKENKNAVLVGTTNKRSLPFEQDSNRRLALVDVKWIDTDAMSKINWHHFYNHYVSEGKKALMNGNHSWKLTEATIKLQYLENEQFRSQSNKEIILREIFDFDMTIHKNITAYDMPGIQNNNALYIVKNVVGVLKQRYPEVYFAPAEMKHLLLRLCGKYTHTTNKRKTLSNAKGYIENGIIKQGQHVRYVLPPIKTDF